MGNDDETKAAAAAADEKKDGEMPDAAAAAAAAADDDKKDGKKRTAAEAADGDGGDDGGDDKKKPAAKKAKKEKKPAPPPANRERRTTKKASEVYNPEDFHAAAADSKKVTIIDGRGTKIADIEMLRTHLEGYKAGSQELQMAHKLLYPQRGKPIVQHVRSNIMHFNGYLVKHDKSVSQEDIEKLDDEAHAKIGGRAHKLTTPQLKQMCDIFLVDRSGKTTKDELVDVLLDFLESPNVKHLAEPKKKQVKVTAKGSTKKGDKKDKKKKGGKAAAKKPAAKKKTTTKKKKATAAAAAVEAEVEEEPVDGEMPNDAQLKTWCKAYVRCFPSETTTVKHAMETANAKFGVDMKEQKDFIKDALATAAGESPKKKKKKSAAKKPAAAAKDDDDDDDDDDKKPAAKDDDDKKEAANGDKKEAAADDEKEAA